MKKLINILFNDFTNDNRVFKESVSLQQNGYKVLLVATHFDKSLPREETIEGFVVKRFDVGKFKMLPFNLISFWIHIIKNYSREMVIHCNDLYALPPAFLIKKCINRKAKIVYDCHEHETEASVYVGKPVTKFFAKIVEKLIIKSADSVITVSESIAKDYQKMYGIKKPYLVMNSPRYKKYKNQDLFRKELGISKDKILFLFQGEYRKGKGVDSLIEIFAKMESLNNDLVLIFLVYGEGTDVLREKITKHKNMFWHYKVDLNVYMDYVSSTDWGFLLLEDISINNDYALPNKLFDYVMGGLPVIVSNLKEMSKFVTENDVGYVVDPRDTKSVISILKNITHKTKYKYNLQLEKASKKYCWENQEKILLKIYESLYK